MEVPDAWVVLKCNNKYRVYAQYRGAGYGATDSWRLSSDVDELIEHADHYLAVSKTPTTYKLGKKREGIGNYWLEGVFERVVLQGLKKAGEVEQLRLTEVATED